MIIIIRARRNSVTRRLVVLVVQWFGVGLVIERSLVQQAAGTLSSQLG